jgi:hypothetical protein
MFRINRKKHYYFERPQQIETALFIHSEITRKIASAPSIKALRNIKLQILIVNLINYFLLSILFRKFASNIEQR